MVLREVKNYVLMLVARSYSIVIVFALLLLCFIVWPFNYNVIGFDSQEISAKIVKIDLFFVPVFWIMIDKDVYKYAKEAIKKKYRSLMMKFE